MIPKKGNKILVAGMPQSGSTLFCNILDLVLTDSGFGFDCHLYHETKMYKDVVNKEFLSQANPEDNILIKEHHYQEYLSEWADLILICKRDIRDCIASRRRRGKALFSKGKHLKQSFPTEFDGFRAWCNYLVDDCFIQWEDSLDYVFDYESFKNGSTNVVDDLNSLLGTRSDPDRIMNLVDNLDESTSKFGIRSKVTAGGKVGNWKSELSEGERRFIEEYCSEWIVE
jgi:hypothetical protein